MIISQHDKNNSFRTRESYLHLETFICQLSGISYKPTPIITTRLKKTDKKKLYIPSGNTELLAVSGLNITLSIFSWWNGQFCMKMVTKFDFERKKCFVLITIASCIYIEFSVCIGIKKNPER